MGIYIFDMSTTNIKYMDAVCLIRIMVEKQTTLFAPSNIIKENAIKFYFSRVKVSSFFCLS